MRKMIIHNINLNNTQTSLTTHTFLAADSHISGTGTDNTLYSLCHTRHHRKKSENAFTSTAFGPTLCRIWDSCNSQMKKKKRRSLTNLINYTPSSKGLNLRKLVFSNLQRFWNFMHTHLLHFTVTQNNFYIKIIQKPSLTNAKKKEVILKLFS